MARTVADAVAQLANQLIRRSGSFHGLNKHSAPPIVESKCIRTARSVDKSPHCGDRVNHICGHGCNI